MDAIVAQIQTFAQSADHVARLTLQNALRKILVQLRAPEDVVMESFNSSMLMAVMRMGADMRLFHILVENKAAMNVDALASATGSEPAFMQRITRYLASNDSIEEVGVDEYAANKTTHVLGSELGEAFIYHCFDTFGPVLNALPEFHKADHYRDVSDNTRTAFQAGHHTPLQAFDFMVQNPEHLDSLQKLMTAFRGSEWTEGFALLDCAAKKVAGDGLEPEKVFFVDVGGGHGHQSVRLVEKYPHLRGRVVLQDMPQVVEHAMRLDGIRAEAHDFFQPEPIKGARFYYMRRIMHDWSDEKSAIILRHLADALAEDSRILIDDLVLPNQNALREGTASDIAMMAICGGKERSRAQWETLADSAGLAVESVHAYDSPISTYTAVVVLNKI